MAASYEAAMRAGDVNPVGSFRGPGVQSHLMWTRHFSAPTLPVVEE